MRTFALALLLTAATLGAAQEGPVTVGSKVDTEGSVLAQIMRLMLEANGFQVNDRSGFGTTSVVREALLAGEIDMYPEYTGSALTFYPNADVPEDLSTQPDELYATVKELDAEAGVTDLGRSPANNTWAIAVPQALAEENGLETMTDLAAYINDGGEFKLAASQEFVDRPDALPAFEETYGFDVSSEQLVILAGGNTTQTETAAANGTDGVNAAMAYGTDGTIAALGLVTLTDPENAVAIYQPFPAVRTEVAEQYPQLAEILDPVFASLDETVLQDMNGQVAVDGADPAEVAQTYLTEAGFLE